MRGGQGHILSLDAMGGDAGPEVVIAGADQALARRGDLRFIYFGDEDILASVLQRYPRAKAAGRVVHTTVAVRMDDRPSQALRQGRWHSSMWKAIEAVKHGHAQACVSAGNTGALMAMAKFCLRTMANIERPAIAALWPTTHGESIVLDVGATIGADAQQLIDFAMMGGAMARALFSIKRPSVGLLNIGVEEVKGLEDVRTAGKLLREINLPTLNYHGFVEGDELGRGVVDVVITEGFSGNIALKTAEGTARLISFYLGQALRRSLLSRMGAWLAKSAFDTLRERMDPRTKNGGVFLGLNGIVIKSHGGTDAQGFASAIDLAYEMVHNDLLEKIGEDLRHYHRNTIVLQDDDLIHEPSDQEKTGGDSAS